jgi:hypothetical protein
VYNIFFKNEGKGIPPVSIDNYNSYGQFRQS